MRENGGATDGNENMGHGGDIYIACSQGDLASAGGDPERVGESRVFRRTGNAGAESGEEKAAIEESAAVLFVLSKESANAGRLSDILRFARGAGKRVAMVRFNDDKMPVQFVLEFCEDGIDDWRESWQKENLLDDLRATVENGRR